MSVKVIMLNQKYKVYIVLTYSTMNIDGAKCSLLTKKLPDTLKRLVLSQGARDTPLYSHDETGPTLNRLRHFAQWHCM